MRAERYGTTLEPGLMVLQDEMKHHAAGLPSL